MDEASESQEMPAVPLLQYASRAEAADALRAYRLVGTALVLYYCGTIAGSCVAAAGYFQMGIGSWAVYIQQGAGVLLPAISLVGAVCMTRQLRVGALVVLRVAALQIVAQCLIFLVQAFNLRTAPPGIFLRSAGSMTTSMLQTAAIALLAYLLWDHCRKRGAWG